MKLALATRGARPYPASRAARLLGFLAATACLAGCGRIADIAAVAKGNGLHERGRFQDAVAAYLGVREPRFEPTVDYDLANVYARLGESGAAAELYEKARQGGDAGLRADSSFNEGVALHEKGRYEEAWRAFRAALTLYLADPSSFPSDFGPDARRNLELSWRAWKKRSLVPPESVVPSGRSAGDSAEEELRLLRRLETGRWKPGTRESPGDERGDY